ncbi:L,D-transpeptidase [Lichenihabitans sp. PAMC28606]|uniref:L,D-transpeptidase n=1 Tax=Lichenihabitans sp. PAMC28606 TaxID=2880932 RepID=UPI001D0A3FFA|nr:L,D-transpeptidase [Lichenihabitans sp. PAMC28606]UDL93767.1 L,D-transpeptidase [Lichenihabitans sp. PAMC28606]
MVNPSRRSLLLGAASLVGASYGAAFSPKRAMAQEFADPAQLYAQVDGEPFAVPAVNLKRINPHFLRTVVEYNSNEAPGTIIIDPATRYLYVVNGDGRAIRYGVGVGRQGFSWSGVATINAKREWPDWYPPKEMMARDPHVIQAVEKLQGGLGMRGGPGNPLGARAMYLYQNGKDTLYRIHGTIEPWTIGTSVSSGCIRMINQDVIDLYSRIPVGTKVMVLGPNTNGGLEARQEPQARRAQPVLQDDQTYDPNYDMMPPDADQ